MIGNGETGMDTLWIETLFGAHGEPMGTGQMTLRAIVIFAFGVLLFRYSARRAFGRDSAFDIVMAIIVGANLSRTLTGNAPMLPTLTASFALVLLHWAMSVLAFRSRWFGRLVKGKPQQLISDGALDYETMRQCKITEHDLEEAARINHLDSLAKIHAAYLERSGTISVLPRGRGAKSH